MSNPIDEANEQLRRQNNQPSWRDCNAAGLPHLWRFTHRVDGALYHSCQRVSCNVHTRTTKTIMPPTFLRG